MPNHACIVPQAREQNPDKLLGERLKKAYLDELPIEFIGVVRDVWVYFENAYEVRIFVILVDVYKGRADDVCDWVADVAATLSDEGIAVRELHVQGPDGTPLSVLQSYYGLGLAELSNDEERTAE